MLFYLGMAAEATAREIFSFFCNHGFCFLHQPELQILKDYLKNCHLVKLLMFLLFRPLSQSIRNL